MVGLWVYTGLIQGIKRGWYFDTSLSFSFLCCWFLRQCWLMVTRGFGTVLTRKKGDWNLWRKYVPRRTLISKQRFSKGWWNKLKHNCNIITVIQLYLCILPCSYCLNLFVSFNSFVSLIWWWWSWTPFSCRNFLSTNKIWIRKSLTTSQSLSQFKTTNKYKWKKCPLFELSILWNYLRKQWEIVTNSMCPYVPMFLWEYASVHMLYIQVFTWFAGWF